MSATIKSSIVGQKYHPGAHHKLLNTPPGSTVTLVRDPKNQFDPNAVRCEIDGVMCGFVPSAQAARLAKDIDGGKTVSATLYGYAELNIEVADEPFHDDEIPELT